MQLPTKRSLAPFIGGNGFPPFPPSNSPLSPLSCLWCFPRLDSTPFRYGSKTPPSLKRVESLVEGGRGGQPSAKNSTLSLLFLAPLLSVARSFIPPTTPLVFLPRSAASRGSSFLFWTLVLFLSDPALLYF